MRQSYEVSLSLAATVRFERTRSPNASHLILWVSWPWSRRRFFQKGIRAKQILQYAFIRTGIARFARCEILFRLDNSGLYYVGAKINGLPICFFIDIGANTVTLFLQNAKLTGLNAYLTTFEQNNP